MAPFHSVKGVARIWISINPIRTEVGLFPIMILGFLNTKIYKDVQERRARNVPVGSSTLSNHRERSYRHRGLDEGETSTSLPTKNVTKFRWSAIHESMRINRYKMNRSRFHQKTNGVSPSTSANGIKTTILIEEVIPLR